jgi:hypothetical protein
MAQSVQSSGGLMLKVGMDLNHSSMQNEFYKVMNKLQKDATIDMAIKVDNDEFTKAVEHFEDEMGNIIEVTNIFSRSWGNVQREITNIQTPLDRLNAATKSQKTNTDKLSLSQQNLNTHIKQSVSLFQDFTNTFLKMAKFNTINLIYDGLITKMSEAIEITNDFDKAMTEFKKVTDTSNLSLSAYTETLGQLGEVTGRSATQMLEAATEFSKGGFTADESAKLAQVATLYQNIADAEISAGEAASFIISQMKAFDIEADKATTILDKVNEVSNNYSVSSTDIASALTKQSASLAAYGNDLNESIALNAIILGQLKQL